MNSGRGERGSARYGLGISASEVFSWSAPTRTPALKKPFAQALGCSWRRYSVHFLRESPGHARRDQQPMLAALIRPVFTAETGEQAREVVGAALDHTG